MPQRLPARPNLEHLRAQARALLTKLKEGDADAALTLAEYLPRAADLSPTEVNERGFRLADAQAAIARKSGFSAWPCLARHVDRLRSMEGKWAFRSLEIDGQAMPPSILTASFLLIDGDRFRMESPEGNYEGIFTIDIEQAPHKIDLDFVEGPEAGNRCGGLFELDNDRLRLCLGLVGAARPERFATTPGSGHALEDLVRVEHARPPGVDGGTSPPPEPTPPVAPDPGNFDLPLSPSLEMLQGEWLPVELVTSGVPLQEAYLPYGSRIHSGVETRVVFGGQTMVHAKVRFNENTTPAEVDYLNLAGRSKGSISLGVFRREGERGEEAVFCMGSPGGPRPADFTCGAGSGRTLSRWKRKA